MSPRNKEPSPRPFPLEVSLLARASHSRKKTVGRLCRGLLNRGCNHSVFKLDNWCCNIKITLWTIYGTLYEHKKIKAFPGPNLKRQEGIYVEPNKVSIETCFGHKTVLLHILKAFRDTQQQMCSCFSVNLYALTSFDSRIFQDRGKYFQGLKIRFLKYKSFRDAHESGF